LRRPGVPSGSRFRDQRGLRLVGPGVPTDEPMIARPSSLFIVRSTYLSLVCVHDVCPGQTVGARERDTAVGNSPYRRQRQHTPRVPDRGRETTRPASRPSIRRAGAREDRDSPGVHHVRRGRLSAEAQSPVDHGGTAARPAPIRRRLSRGTQTFALHWHGETTPLRRGGSKRGRWVGRPMEGRPPLPQDAAAAGSCAVAYSRGEGATVDRRTLRYPIPQA
jgi:hypothetical protein